MVKNLNFGKKLQFWQKITILLGNLNFGQESYFKIWNFDRNLDFDQGLEFSISSFRFHVLGFEFSISRSRFRVFDFEISISRSRFRVFDFEFSISIFQFRVFDFLEKCSVYKNRENTLQGSVELLKIQYLFLHWSYLVGLPGRFP